MDILNRHVTIRRFSDKDISDELIESLIYSGTRASTTGNMQLYSVVINRDKTLKNSLAALHFNQSAAVSAPVLLTFLADIHRFSEWCYQRNAIPGFNNILSFFNAMIDATLVAQNVAVAAENASLGICYLGTVLYNSKEIIELLKLPFLTFPVATLAIGWPSETPEQTDRIPLRGVLHNESYQSYTKEKISELFTFKESLESSLQYVNENRKETLAQVFTDVRYKKSDNEFYSGKLLEAIRNQGFVI